MDIIIDANILFAALIRDSKSYHLIMTDASSLFSPEFVFTEFEKHKEEILEKTEHLPEEFFRLLAILKRKIALVPLEELAPYVAEAEKLSPDPDDIAYFALAIKQRCGIWSQDKAMKKQDKITIYSTEELMRLLQL